MTKWLYAGAAAAPLVVLAACGAGEPGGYESPYEIRYTHPVRELVGDLERGPRGDRREESAVPHGEWYSRKVRAEWGAWGPPARHYPAPEGVAEWGVERKRERVVAAALRFRGYAYQHHHVPDWEPPADWPWLKVGAGHNGKGFDCSDFTSFAYNQGFGIMPSTGIRQQSEERETRGPGGRPWPTRRVELPADHNDVGKVLKTGDLLFIRGKPGGEVTHVVIWVGAVGRSPDGLPLIIDSHGDGVKDSTGTRIPDGVQVRPFAPHSWYHACASHAHRFFGE